MNLVDVATFLAVLLRVGGWTHAAPFIGEKMVPAKVRMASTVLIALMLTSSRSPISMDELMFVGPAELLLGLVAGFAARLPLSAVEGAGQLLGLSLELGFAGTLDPVIREESLPTRRIAFSLAGLAFLGCGGLEASIHALGGPPLSGHGMGAVLERLVVAAGDVLPAALMGAAPVLVAAVIANLAVGLISRAAPGFNLLALMLVAVLVVGLGVLWATAPHFGQMIFGLCMRASHAAETLLTP